MKKDIHPEYGDVLFKDAQSGDTWIGRSTKLNGPTEVIDGKEYKVITLEISSFSHPFFSGKKSFVDSAGRVDKYNRRFGRTSMKSRKKAKTGEPEAAAEKAEG